MFESDDWSFEDTFDDVDEKALQPRPLCQNEEEPASVKRRKVDSCNFSSFVASNPPKLESDAATSTVSNDPPASGNRSSVSRGNLLLGIFQENASNAEAIDLTKETSKAAPSLSKEVPCVQSSRAKATSITSHYKESKGKNVKSKAEPSKRVKLVRIFPGPAGLVPDTKSSSIPAASCLSSAIELESKSSKCIEINSLKSQDERNLFDDGAWKLLLDDLPSDFFVEYGISAIKSRANTSNCDSMRVKFVAGMIDYVDHGRDDPLIVLKDSTGSIEGTVHRDIALNYPGALEPNMVVLLRDVGLLKTVTYVVTNKYHILVSKTSLLAVYSNKGRVVSTASVEDALSSISGSEPDRDQFCTPVSERCAATGLRQTDRGNAPLRSTSSSDRKSASGTRYSKQVAGNSRVPTESIFEDLNDLDDVFFVDREFTSSAEQNRPDRSSSEAVPRTSETRRNESQARRSHLESTKKDSMIQLADAAVVTREERPNVTSPATRHEGNTKNLLNCFAGDNKYDSDDEFLSQLDIDSISSF